MTIGVSLHPSSVEAGGVNAVDEVMAQARAAREAGLGSVWFGQRFDYDGIDLAGLVGREVPDLRVGTAAVPILARHPILLAAQAQTAQAATHGRYTLGIALGAAGLLGPAFGVDNERPIKRLREFLHVLRSIFDTGAADLRGETITAVTPLPAGLAGARPSVPVLVAAMGPQALRATGELAEGTLPFLAGPRALGEHIVPTLTAAAEAAGRPRPRVVALVAAVVTEDTAAVREASNSAMALYERIPSYQRVIALSGAERAADLALIGDEEAVAKGIRQYFEAGATEVVLTQTGLGGPLAQQRTWRLAGELSARG